MTRLTVCLLAAAALVSAQKAAHKATAPADAKSRTAALFAKYNRTDTPGCTAGVSIDGIVVQTSAYGMADLEHAIALSSDSVLEAGSISKQFTATAVLLLAQQGKLSLDDPVRKYIPELPDYGAPLTIRHLLNHTSGLRDWGSLEAIGGWPRTTRVNTHGHVLEIISRQKSLNYPPGTAYSYTNSGYNLAAILVSRVAGKPFAEFTKDAIFTPLGMTHTEWRDDFRRIVRNRAVAYDDAGRTVRQEMPFENVHGNGGLLTTVGDLLLWNRNFTDPKLGGRALVDAQQQRAKLNDGTSITYAAGLIVGTYKGLPEVTHSGSTAGYRAWLGRYPEQSLSVAVLCNAASANAPNLGRGVADVFLGSAVRPQELKTVAVDAASLAAKAGTYRSTRDHSVINITAYEGVLRWGTRVVRPVAGARFENMDGTRAEFDGPGRLVVSTPADPNHVYEKVEKVAPARAELEALAGEYTSEEAGVTLRVAVEGDGLVILRRPDSKFRLTPSYQDGFVCPLGSVRFLRDSAGRVSEMSVGESRVWDLRFRRR